MNWKKFKRNIIIGGSTELTRLFSLATTGKIIHLKMVVADHHILLTLLDNHTKIASSNIDNFFEVSVWILLYSPILSATYFSSHKI